MHTMMPVLMATAVLLSGNASASICDQDYGLAVPHQGAVLPAGFRVVWEDASATRELKIHDAANVEVALEVRDGSAYAPVSLPAGDYTFTVRDGETNELLTSGNFSVADVPEDWLVLNHQPLRLEVEDEELDGCGDQPRVGDVLARVRFDAPVVPGGGWWISLNVASSDGVHLGTGATLVSPPSIPGTERGVSVNLGPDAPEEVCGTLTITSPTGETQETEDLGCHSLDESSGASLSLIPPFGCSTVGNVAPVGAALGGLSLLFGLTRRRRR